MFNEIRLMDVSIVRYDSITCWWKYWCLMEMMFYRVLSVFDECTDFRNECCVIVIYDNLLMNQMRKCVEKSRVEENYCSLIGRSTFYNDSQYIMKITS